jgi:uncharacterized protein (TIGR02145 family)
MNKSFFIAILYLGKIFVQIYKKIAIFAGHKRKKMKKTIFCTALLLLLITAFSCKKKEEDTTKPTLSGLVLNSDHTTFMGMGVTVHVTPDVTNLVSSDKKTFPETIGIYFVLNGTSDRDTTTTNVDVSNPTYEITLDEPGNYVLYCYAFGGDKFYNASATLNFTVVDPASALTGLPDLPVVQIAGNSFLTVELEGKTWMANNLYGTNSGTYFQNSEILASVFGQYYTWTEAQTACPAGWHLPSAEDFDKCLGDVAGDAMVDAKFVEKVMWPYWPQVPITNKKQFCAIPVGYRDFTLEKTPEDGYQSYACFWTSDDNEEDLGEFRYIYQKENAIQAGHGDKHTLALSVRCVRD